MSVILLDGDLPPEVSRTIRTAGRVAVDTETSGLDWARDRLHLCQLFTPQTGPVLLRHIDDEPRHLWSVMRDAAVTKVMHFAPFDLRFLEAHSGTETRSVACTKAASRLLDPTDDHSLKALLHRYLGVDLEKGAVRVSDWGAANLSDAQVAYAVGDVSHLLDLHQILTERLEETKLIGIFEQVCDYMPLDAHLEVSGYPNPLTY